MITVSYFLLLYKAFSSISGAMFSWGVKYVIKKICQVLDVLNPLSCFWFIPSGDIFNTLCMSLGPMIDVQLMTCSLAFQWVSVLSFAKGIKKSFKMAP